MFEFYQVGGSIRDQLMGLKSKDIDYSVVYTGDEIVPQKVFGLLSKYLIEQGYTIFLETPDCYTIRAMFPKNHPHFSGVADFVLARKEVGYIPFTRTPILQVGTLYDDLERRDFTVNAIAKDKHGNLIDYFDGVEAIESRMLLTPINPGKTFKDDPLRILRALRFSITKDFIIPPITWNAMFYESFLESLKSVVSTERIREELYKMLRHDTIKTLRLFNEIDKIEPSFMESILGDKLWLKPTTEKQ